MINILMSRGILHSPLMVSNAKKYIKKTDKVLVVAFSFFEGQFKDKKAYDLFYSPGGEYYIKMVEAFLPYGIKESQIEWLHYYKDNQESAIQKIKNAEIIYFPGGSPILMMQRINEFGIKSALESPNKVFIGSSAGAMIQIAEYHVSPDREHPKFSYEEGLNLISGISIEVHYRRRKKQKSAMRKVNRSYHHPIIAIPDEGAVIIDNEVVNLIGNAFLMYGKKGVIR
ncbi:MAG: Type 1 glutamine amidotransferase-like domain-containing protein [Acholeplasmataceae bacterium]|nr:Type 1 glutamine amidotransferase-like domain-containing protein [Acholeplasmataceae bacterium]